MSHATCNRCMVDFADQAILLCPLHAAAEGMRATLERIVSAEARFWLDTGMERPSNMDELSEEIDRARALLRASEGKGTP